MSIGRSPFDPRTNPKRALELAEAFRLNEKSTEQEALEREGVGAPELKSNRDKARQRSWTRTRTVAVVAIILVVLVISIAFFIGLL